MQKKFDNWLDSNDKLTGDDVLVIVDQKTKLKFAHTIVLIFILISSCNV